MAKISGKVTSVRIFKTPPDGEVLGMDGNQVWYGTPDRLGSTTSKEIGHLVESVSFGDSEGDETLTR